MGEAVCFSQGGGGGNLDLEFGEVWVCVVVEWVCVCTVYTHNHRTTQHHHHPNSAPKSPSMLPGKTQFIPALPHTELAGAMGTNSGGTAAKGKGIILHVLQLPVSYKIGDMGKQLSQKLAENCTNVMITMV